MVYHDESRSKYPTLCHGPMIIEDNFIKVSDFVISQKMGFVRILGGEAKMNSLFTTRFRDMLYVIMHSCKVVTWGRDMKGENFMQHKMHGRITLTLGHCNSQPMLGKNRWLVTD